MCPRITNKYLTCYRPFHTESHSTTLSECYQTAEGIWSSFSLVSPIMYTDDPDEADTYPGCALNDVDELPNACDFSTESFVLPLK